MNIKNNIIGFNLITKIKLILFLLTFSTNLMGQEIKTLDINYEFNCSCQIELFDSILIHEINENIKYKTYSKNLKEIIVYSIDNQYWGTEYWFILKDEEQNRLRINLIFVKEIRRELKQTENYVDNFSKIIDNLGIDCSPR